MSAEILTFLGSFGMVAALGGVLLVVAVLIIQAANEAAGHTARSDSKRRNRR